MHSWVDGKKRRLPYLQSGMLSPMHNLFRAMDISYSLTKLILAKLKFLFIWVTLSRFRHQNKKQITVWIISHLMDWVSPDLSILFPSANASTSLRLLRVSCYRKWYLTRPPISDCLILYQKWKFIRCLKLDNANNSMASCYQNLQIHYFDPQRNPSSLAPSVTARL